MPKQNASVAIKRGRATSIKRNAKLLIGDTATRALANATLVGKKKLKGILKKSSYNPNMSYKRKIRLKRARDESRAKGRFRFCDNKKVQ